MQVKDFVKLLQELPQDARLVKDNPDASDEGLGHWFIPQFLHLVGFEKVELDGGLVLKPKYSENDFGWQDDCYDAILDGRFFKTHNIKAEDFVRSCDERPTKDGNYICICKHGDRRAIYTVEKQAFYAKVNADGYERNNGQWGFSCEHIPSFCKSPSYPVVMWSPKSYKPFKERK